MEEKPLKLEICFFGCLCCYLFYRIVASLGLVSCGFQLFMISQQLSSQRFLSRINSTVIVELSWALKVSLLFSLLISLLLLLMSSFALSIRKVLRKIVFMKYRKLSSSLFLCNQWFVGFFKFAFFLDLRFAGGLLCRFRFSLRNAIAEKVNCNNKLTLYKKSS